MEVLNAQIQFGNSWNVIQREEAFACEIVRRDNIVIHYSEGYHCALLCALLKSNSSELEALVEDGIQSFLQKIIFGKGKFTSNQIMLKVSDIS